MMGVGGFFFVGGAAKRHYPLDPLAYEGICYFFALLCLANVLPPLFFSPRRSLRPPLTTSLALSTVGVSFVSLVEGILIQLVPDKQQ